jgi:hypothetical protein
MLLSNTNISRCPNGLTLQGAVEGLGWGAVAGGDNNDDFVKDFKPDFAMFKRNIYENNRADKVEDEEDDEDV